MKIGIIGAGKVGTTLGKYLVSHNVTVRGFYSRTYKSAETAAEFTDTTAYHTLAELVLASDTLFVTTPDGEIGTVWDCIAKDKLQNKIICHFSGSLSSNVFSGIGDTGAYACSIHPMYAFSDKFTSYEQFHTAFLTMEGDEVAIRQMRNLFEKKLSHSVMVMSGEDKMKYHTAAAFASNYMVGLLEVSLRLLSECGFSREDSQRMLSPLVIANLKDALKRGTKAALTGPAERNDLGTVEKHLEVLRGQNAEKIYCSIGEELVCLAEKKHEDRDYTALKNLLRDGRNK